MAQYISKETAKNLNVAPQTLKRWRTTGTQPRGTPQRREQFIQDLQEPSIVIASVAWQSSSLLITPGLLRSQWSLAMTVWGRIQPSPL